MAKRKRSQAAIGVFNLGMANKATGDILQSWIDRKLLDPKNVEQFAAATTYAQKNVEQLAATAAVAGAPLEALKRLEIEAGSVRTQLDQFATSSLTPICGVLTCIDSFLEAA